MGIPEEHYGVYDNGDYTVEIIADSVSFYDCDTGMFDEVYGIFDGNEFVSDTEDFRFTVSDGVLYLTFNGAAIELPKLMNSAENNIDDSFLEAETVNYETYRYTDEPDDINDYIYVTYYDNGNMQIQLGTRMLYAGYASTSEMGTKTPVSGFGGDKLKEGYEYYIALSVDGSTGYITKYDDDDDTTFSKKLEIVN